MQSWRQNNRPQEYWALAADYRNKQIYWTDYRAEKIGKYDWEKNKTTSNLFQGMAHGIENLAVDYVTGNLYWTDSDYKWIMVANKAGLLIVPLTNQIEVLMVSANQKPSWKPIKGLWILYPSLQSQRWPRWTTIWTCFRLKKSISFLVNL